MRGQKKKRLDASFVELKPSAQVFEAGGVRRIEQQTCTNHEFADGTSEFVDHAVLDTDVKVGSSRKKIKRAVVQPQGKVANQLVEEGLATRKHKRKMSVCEVSLEASRKNKNRRAVAEALATGDHVKKGLVSRKKRKKEVAVGADISQHPVDELPTTGNKNKPMDSCGHTVEVAGAEGPLKWSQNNPRTHDRKTTGASDDLRLFVSGIPRFCDENMLRKDFEECGEIVNLKLLLDKETSESRGLAFITYKEEAGFKAALAYDGDVYGGRRLCVKKAHPKGKEGWAMGKSKDRNPGQKPEGCNSVVVKGLSENVTSDDLFKTFARCGRGPTNVGILRDKTTRLSRGTARVDFDINDDCSVDEAMKLQGTVLHGKAFYLDFCQPRQW